MQNSLQAIWCLCVLLIINITNVVSYTGNVGYNSNSNLNNYNSGSNLNTYHTGSNLNTYNTGSNLNIYNTGSNLNKYNNGYGSNINNYNSGYGSNLNSYNSGYGSSNLNSYNSGYGSNYNSGYGTSYNSGYGTNYNSGYGNNYNSGYGTNYNSGYGKKYNSGYGTNYNQGYTKGYGSRYGSNYAKNFYNTFPFFFMNPFGSGYSGFQSGLPWSPFSSFRWSYGQQSEFNPYGHNNMYGVHPLFRYTGNYGVYQNYGYGNRHIFQRNHMMLPLPVGMPFGGHSNQFIFQRRPSLGERIMNSPLLPAALIAAPLLLLAKGKK